MAQPNETPSDDDDMCMGMGFIFGNVDNFGDLDADYLDQDAKDHLSALASSLPDIISLANSQLTTTDPADQDYDRKAEDAVDYEDIDEECDEEYDEPDVQLVSEEDHLLPKREYLSAAVTFSSLNPEASVFDDDDYDEEEEEEEQEHRSIEDDSEQMEPVVLKEYKALEYEKEATILENEDQMDIEDVEEGEESVLNEKSATSLPTLYVEDGKVILQFSELFAIHEPPRKRSKREENRYITYRDRYKSMDLDEDDGEIVLKSHGRIDAQVKQADLIQLDVPLPIREDPQLVKSGIVGGIRPESIEFTKPGRNSCTMGELLKQDIEDDNSSPCESQLSTEVFPLDQHEWEHQILWEDSNNSGEGFESGLETEDMLVQGTNSETEQESFNVVNSKEQPQADKNMIVPFFANALESFGSRGSHSTNDSTNNSRYHPQLLRLESQCDENHLIEHDDGRVKTIKLLESYAFGCFSRLALQERNMGDEAWLESVIWDSDKKFSRSEQIFDHQDGKVDFEILDKKDSQNLQHHAGSMVVSRSSKSNDGSFQEGGESNYGCQFNISNDKFYMNGKSSHQLQANANKSRIHCLRVLHSAPAIKLQTMKNKLSNKDIENFHRPKALWYPHDNELAINQQGKLPTQGSMKIIVMSLGGKGIKLRFGIEETVSSLKAKASRKLDCNKAEAVKMFYMGKELEDGKSLAEQNVQPDSLVHLVRTKVHLRPHAQKLPGRFKSLRPPGAFKKKSDLSTEDGHVFLMEYCEERPLLLSNAGMGANLCTYYQKSSPEDQHGILLRNQSDTLGNVMILEPGEKSPFLGEIHGGFSQSSIETNMYRAPVFLHRLQSTDYLLVRSPEGKLSLRRIDKAITVGQQEPRIEVMSPAPKNLQTYLVNRMSVYVYRQLKSHYHIAADELRFLFSKLSDAVIKKNMNVRGMDLERDKNGQLCWSKKNKHGIPPENDLRKMVSPEDVCSYESMLAGLYRLKCLGITRFTLPASISTATAQLPDEAIVLAAASHIERELQITPWNLSSNFVACTTQDRVNIERLDITGVGDPSGRGLGFSYVRAAPKAPAAAGHIKKKTAACHGAPTVTGTDADLRRLSTAAAREVLLKFNVPDEIIAKQTRWHRIAMIRKLSSEQAASGVLKVDPTTIGKYARGQRMSFLQLKHQAREKCQGIWDRQVLSLSACDGDEYESENEADSDFDSFVGDLEILLDAEEWAEGGETNMSNNEKLDRVKGLEMRRRPSQFETEEIEDEAAEYNKRRLLMQDGDHKKKKKMKAEGEKVGSFPPPQPNVEPVEKANVIQKKSIAIQPDASSLVNESTVKDTTNVNVFKGKKPAREYYVCGACGQPGHIKTKKKCPKFGENTESHPKGIEMKKSAGKPSSSYLSGQLKMKPINNKKPVPKCATKVSVDEAPKGDCSTSKTRVLSLKGFRYGDPGGGMLDKPGSETPGSSKAQPKESKVKSDRPSHSLMPPFTKERGESEPRKPSLSEQPCSRTEKNQVASRRHTISIKQPSLSMDKDRAEVVTWLSTEGEQHQRKLVVTRTKEITDHIGSSLEESSWFESRETMRLSENSLDRGPKEGRMRREEQEISQYVSDFERNGAEYAPRPKRRKMGKVGLANILEGIVDTLREKEVQVSYLFLKPVLKKEAPDYLNIVKHPMDLSKIRDKVRKMEYRDRQQFRHDVWQIKFNAHLYNDGRNPAIPPLADELLVKCDALLDKYRDELNEAEKGIIDPND